MPSSDGYIDITTKTAGVHSDIDAERFFSANIYNGWNTIRYRDALGNTSNGNFKFSDGNDGATANGNTNKWIHFEVVINNNADTVSYTVTPAEGSADTNSSWAVPATQKDNVLNLVVIPTRSGDSDRAVEFFMKNITVNVTPAA